MSSGVNGLGRSPSISNDAEARTSTGALLSMGSSVNGLGGFSSISDYVGSTYQERYYFLVHDQSV
jgi:hypothetical protein